MKESCYFQKTLAVIKNYYDIFEKKQKKQKTNWQIINCFWIKTATDRQKKTSQEIVTKLIWSCSKVHMQHYVCMYYVSTYLSSSESTQFYTCFQIPSLNSSWKKSSQAEGQGDWV